MRSPMLTLRRTAQTLSTFQNGPALLAGLAGWGSKKSLLFRTRAGCTVACPNFPGARVPIYEVFAEDAYRIRKLGDLGTNPVILDIGAHIGCFSLAAAMTYRTATIAAYEASPSTATWLARNIADNGLAERVTTHAAAISNHDGVIKFADNARGSSLNGLTASSDTAQVEVPCVRLSRVLAELGPRISLVKIDTEGAEYGMVAGTQPSDWAGVERVVLEYHDVDGHTWSELRDFFTESGLIVHRIEEASARQGTAWLARKGN